MFMRKKKRGTQSESQRSAATHEKKKPERKVPARYDSDAFGLSWYSRDPDSVCFVNAMTPKTVVAGGNSERRGEAQALGQRLATRFFLNHGANFTAWASAVSADSKTAPGPAIRSMCHSSPDRRSSTAPKASSVQ